MHELMTSDSTMAADELAPLTPVEDNVSTPGESYISHFIAGLAIGAVLYVLFLVSVMGDLPGNPIQGKTDVWNLKMNWEIAGLLLPVGATMISLYTATRRPVKAFNSCYCIAASAITIILCFLVSCAAFALDAMAGYC